MCIIWNPKLKKFFLSPLSEEDDDEEEEEDVEEGFDPNLIEKGEK